MNCIQGAKCVCYSINTSIPNVITWNDSPFSFTEYIGEVWGRKAYRLSAPDCPPCLALYENGGFCQVCETELRPIQSGVYSSLLRWNVMKSKDQNGCEMILYEPSNEKSDSLIVLLHGGPHNCFAACSRRRQCRRPGVGDRSVTIRGIPQPPGMPGKIRGAAGRVLPPVSRH